MNKAKNVHENKESNKTHVHKNKNTHGLNVVCRFNQTASLESQVPNLISSLSEVSGDELKGG